MRSFVHNNTKIINLQRVFRRLSYITGRKKILFELRMLSELNSKRTNINLCTNSNPMSTNDELEFTTFSK